MHDHGKVGGHDLRLNRVQDAAAPHSKLGEALQYTETRAEAPIETLFLEHCITVIVAANY